MMPRFKKLVSDWCSSFTPLLLYYPNRIRKRKATADRIAGTSRPAHRSTLEEGETARLKKEYVPLGEQEWNVASQRDVEPRQNRIQRTISIEMVVRDQSDAEKSAASMV